MSIAKIAQLAGVSDATVSRVLNNKPGPSTETAHNVSMIARELGYLNRKNRGKSRNAIRDIKNDTFAFLSFGYVNSNTLITMIENIESVLAEQHFRLNVNFRTEEDTIPKMVLGGYVDGVFLFGKPNLSQSVVEKFKKIPTIWTLYNYGGWGSHFTPDNIAIGRVGAEYAHAQGYKDIAVLMASKPTSHAPFGERAKGFIDYFSDKGLPLKLFFSQIETTMFGISDTQYSEMIAEEIDKLLEQMLADGCPDVIFAPNDKEVAELYQQLAKRGVEIGVDTKIITCDGNSLPPMYPMPAVVDVRADLVGRYAAEHMLLRLSDNDAGDIKTLVQPRLNMP